ncbi:MULTISPECIES: hypothetical protein [unclassified Micromonospora]|uniref:hypothetical protein n=1 Tax=unclassified Micromonospora TaxID=2617518 RepID=UPI001C233DFE|nr:MULTISPECIES: hypothetical protein [unclassified Micromonospora]MBU8861668.1 hypothetical protein [Micromonospora sp. WMMB482]MDM4781237.1 hypothetical protein [Micromonospora sp. b486]
MLGLLLAEAVGLPVATPGYVPAGCASLATVGSPARVGCAEEAVALGVADGQPRASRTSCSNAWITSAGSGCPAGTQGSKVQRVSTP